MQASKDAWEPGGQRGSCAPVQELLMTVLDGDELKTLPFSE